MDLNKVNMFCAVVEYGSISKASQYLFCSQPAISKQIVALENLLGYSLFERHGKKLVLNSKGELVYKFGKDCQSRLQQLHNDLQELNCGMGNTIRFGANNYIGMYVLPAFLDAFKAKHPEINTDFSINFTPHILQLLDEEQIQFALVPESMHMSKKTYETIPFLRDKMKLIMPAGHPLTKLKKIHPADIVEYPFLISRKESLTREYVINCFKSLGVTPGKTIDLHNSESIKQGVLIGIGISIIAQELVKSEVKQKTIVQAGIEGMPCRTLYVVYKKSAPLPKEAETFIEAIKNVND